MRDRRAALLTLLAPTVALATISLAAPASAKTPTPTCFGKKATIVVTGRHAHGTKKNDVIVVTNKKGATVNGGAGNDLICGGPGKDVLAGGAGNDKINGGKGNDKVDGGSGNDTLLGGAGNDAITLGAGKDTADGGAGNDTITGGPGVQVIKGGAGNDHLISYQGGTIARAHALGMARVVAGCTQTLIGGPGADTGTSGACPVTFIGDASDTIVETPGDAPVTVVGAVTVVGSTTTVTNPALQGTVRGTANAVLGGITLEISGPGTAFAVTDTTGHYAFPATTPSGTYSLVVNPAGVAGHQQNTAYQTSAAQSVTLPRATALDVTLQASPAPNPTTITGLVADGGGNLADVPVSAFETDGNFSASIATDSSGRYTISNLPAGHTYDIVANDLFAHVGTYLPRRSVGNKTNVAITTAGSSVPTITLTHAATISGVVHDTTPAPLAGAFVSAFDSATQNAGYGTAGADGHYTIGSLTDTGSWGLGAFVDQYEPAAATPFATVSTLDDQVTGVDVVLRHQAPQGGPYYVSGAAVSDGTGNGIAVPVTLRDGTSTLVDTQTSDASDGTYFMAGTYPAGSYTLTVNDPTAVGFDPAYAHDVQSVTLPANGGNTDQNPDYSGYSSLVASGSLDVLAQDAAATPNPVAGVLVSATDGDGFTRSATTGADGHAVIDGLQPGYLAKVTFTGSGYYAEEQDGTINVSSNAVMNFTATMVPAANTITGTVTDNAGTPVALAGIPVAICPNNVAGGVPAECLSPIATAADGTWTSPQLPAGDYEVTVNFEQYSGYSAAYGGDDQLVTVSDVSSPTVASHLVPAGAVTVTVYAADGTTPVADAIVYTVGQTASRSGSTGVDGTVTLTGVEAGTGVEVDAQDSNATIMGSTNVDVTAGATAAGSITLDTPIIY